MSIRLPLTTVLDVNNSTINGAGPASVAGGVALPFALPQDTDNVVVKLEASVLAGGVSATFQTSDNGGSTWYDVARTSIVSNTSGSVLAQWLNISTTTPGFGPTVVAQTSVVGSTNTTIVLGTIGSAGASTLGSSQASGLPIMGLQNRIFLRYTAAVTSIISERVQVKVNNQSPRS